MEPWKIPAFAAAVFAGLTSVIAKAGLKNLSADIGLTVRTTFVAAFAVANFFLWADALVSAAALREADARTFALLALSAFITALSWVCYYRAMKDGTVTFVSVVDKGSILVTLALCVMLLGASRSPGASPLPRR